MIHYIHLKPNLKLNLIAFFCNFSGATSSCINDIANDDFVPILQIEEVMKDTNNESKIRDIDDPNMLSIPKIHTSASDSSISNILDFLGNNSETENLFLQVPMASKFKSSGSLNSRRNSSCGSRKSSDVSLSFFLDREHIGDTYDENTFANVNADRKTSNSNLTFQLDE